MFFVLISMPCNFLKKEASAQVFFCKFCKIFKITYYVEIMKTAASVFVQYHIRACRKYANQIEFY